MYLLVRGRRLATRCIHLLSTGWPVRPLGVWKSTFLRSIPALLWLCSPLRPALGWGATGHEWVTGIAIEKLPDDVPAFVRDPAELPELALMGSELDRSKGSGETHDKERDPGHYVDLTDDGKAPQSRSGC
jgi:hypothetical protein